MFFQFYWFFFQQPEIGVLKLFVRKIRCKVTVMVIAVWLIFQVNVNFPWKRPFAINEPLRTCFSKLLATDNGINIVQNICLIEQKSLSKTTTGCLWNFFCLELCMHFISNFTSKDNIKENLEKLLWSLSLLNLYRPSYASLLKKDIFKTLEKLTRKYIQRNTTSCSRV